MVPLTGIAPLLYEYFNGIPKTLLLLNNDEIDTLSVYLLLSKSLISSLSCDNTSPLMASDIPLSNALSRSKGIPSSSV